MSDLKAGDRVSVTEHDDATRQPKPGGEVLPATVTGTTGLYVHVKLASGIRATFWRESLWRAWDGEFRWRITRD
jgi:hypothetical protein